MRILHYSLGLPPYRSGGLTKYCTDLMIEQIKLENEVFLMFPGRMSFIKDENPKIKYYRNYKNIKVFELVNPLPVPLLKGIYKPELFYKACDKDVFINFLKKINVDIVHVHTFMGLYKEFLVACKELGIKTVFTSHDYFGICPKVNFINYKGKRCEDINFEECYKCNITGDSIKKIKILQSQQYRYIKDKGIVDKLKKYIKSGSNINLKEKNQVKVKNSSRAYQYLALSKYYYSMFENIDKIFFNSELAKSIYQKYIDTDNIVIPITHGGIKDNRKIKDYNQNKILKLTYLGPYKEYKGFNLLCNVMEEIKKEGYSKIILNAYGDTNTTLETHKNITIRGKYTHSDLNTIFESTDVLIVPSIWNETFGFVVLEALSYGVPVLVTEKVGSKDLIYNKEFIKGEIVELSISIMKDKIIQFYKDRTILKMYNYNIVNENFEYSLDKHCKRICSNYEKLLAE